MILDPLTLTIRYAAFAGLAMAVNLGTQWLVFRAGEGPVTLYAAIVLGTGTGLITKYLLDKQWIFFDTDHSLRRHSSQFSLYTFLGGFTTLIFWGTELLFECLFASAWLRYVGGAIGLAIGYLTKYQLDKRYVFREAAA